MTTSTSASAAAASPPFADSLLDSFADVDEDRLLTYDQAFAWAEQYLPAPSATAFVDWLMDTWTDVVPGSSLTVRELLTSHLWQWRGAGFPDPPSTLSS
ncbi:hypothetical protein ABZ635_22700 [Nocardiopsis sp. NPDC007018]|uniref:hypothetical protein n=1 Tax=Nocardiopsis sp. NPDC007018 TaxID=3155721 RepID=UPI0034068BEB